MYQDLSSLGYVPLTGTSPVDTINCDQLLQVLLQCGTPRQLERAELNLPSEVAYQLTELVMATEDEDRINDFSDAFAEAWSRNLAELFYAQANVIRGAASSDNEQVTCKLRTALDDLAIRFERIAEWTKSEIDPLMP